MQYHSLGNIYNKIYYVLVKTNDIKPIVMNSSLVSLEDVKQNNFNAKTACLVTIYFVTVTGTSLLALNGFQLRHASSDVTIIVGKCTMIYHNPSKVYNHVHALHVAFYSHDYEIKTISQLSTCQTATTRYSINTIINDKCIRSKITE